MLNMYISNYSYLSPHTLRTVSAFTNLTHPHTPASGRGFGRLKRLRSGMTKGYTVFLYSFNGLR